MSLLRGCDLASEQVGQAGSESDEGDGSDGIVQTNYATEDTRQVTDDGRQETDHGERNGETQPATEDRRRRNQCKDQLKEKGKCDNETPKTQILVIPFV